MGVPKFYRWISERYPCLSEVVKEYQIPEFDNLYLDMNGIIHICSHPNDDDPHFRITEEDIFKDIFHYIEVLFRMIQPSKIFFMAVDGVAPRAKMNQQRGRRFRSAREAEENEKKAREKGEVLPSEARFDSNCITPGTEFMTKLDAQLQYFVSSKISSDKLWQNCTVIYSGHKTPGEGEHKIMEYIRYTKSQPKYDPNTRHCLYGLDADLIMLGLTSHEPHFSLLREEVRFGGKKSSSKRTPTPEETTFHLLHLSLMREYIEYEFNSLKQSLPFEFDIESVIDDWVFMGFLVGNDFIPHLPGLHINKDALPLLYETYKEVLPSVDGYLNEKGSLNLKRFEKFMQKLTEYDVEKFQEFNDNMKYIRCKRGDDDEEELNERVGRLEVFEFDDDNPDEAFGSLEGNALTSEEVREKLARLDIPVDDTFLEDDESSLNDDEDAQFEAEFRQHKRHYYMTKMMYEDVTPDVLRDQATNYIRGLQWILNYYYNGICSWSWYYPHHYAPYISDVKDFGDIDLSFELGTPFLPFEQLLAVLPPLSVTLLPSPYKKLMLSENSPLKEFYPKEFSTDLNGKQQDWEAVVLIPFINEHQLLEAMKPCNMELSPEELSRNSHGPMYFYTYTPENLGECLAPRYFPPVGVNHAKVKLLWREEWDMPSSDILKGLLPGVRLDVYFAGFPTLRHLEHTFRIEKAAAKVFQQESRGENFILEIKETETENILDLIKNMLCKSIFVNWPHLVEAKVVSVISEKQRHFIIKENIDHMINHELSSKEIENFHILKKDLKNKLMKRWGIDVGEIKYIVYAKEMTGRNYVATSDGKITLEKIWSESEQAYPLQNIVQDISVHDPSYKQYKTIHEYFKPGTKLFMLGHPSYGCMGEVIEIDPQHKGRIRVSMTVNPDPDIDAVIYQYQILTERYMTAYECAAKLSISPQLFARLTGSIFLAKAHELNPFIDRDSATNKLNIGLNLKSNRRSEEVVGFTRKCMESKQWLYSQQCVNSLLEYQELFPEVFEYLRNNSKNDVFQDEIFPTNYKERVPELVKWLKEAPFSYAERCKWGSVLLDQNVINELAKELEKVSNQRAKVIRMQVKPHLLFKPNPLQGSTPPDPKVTFNLFDRVINVREGFTVPLGAVGTIVGIQPGEKESDKLYAVFFDESFTGGLSFFGSAFPKRCYRLNWASMLNLSYGKRANSASSSSFPSPGIKSRNQVDCRQEPINMLHPCSNNATFTANAGVKVKQRGIETNCYNKPYHQQDMNVEHIKATGNYNKPFSFSMAAQEARGTGYAANSLGIKGESYNGTPTSSESDSPQPPNPNKLPKPMDFKRHLNEPQYKENNIGNLTSPNKNDATYNQKNASVRQITSERDVDVIIHGVFYENWKMIRQNGIKKDHRNYIPCVSYVPPKIGSRTYEIHIYLNIRKLLEDGIKLLLLQKGQVLCSTLKNGFIPPKYFEKVVETRRNCIIFPEAFIQPGPGFFEENLLLHGENPKGRGRGRPTKQKGPLKLFENIWSQVESVDQSFGDQYQSSQGLQRDFGISNDLEERKKVSVNDLFRSASQQQPLISTVPRNEQQSFPGAIRNFQGHPNMHIQPCNQEKSRFIPTQVERKHTPRKNYAEPIGNRPEHRPTSLSQSTPPFQPSPSTRMNNGYNSGYFKNATSRGGNSDRSTKPKKKQQRNRIAANFGTTSIRSDNG